jgi:CO dehydrogenase maturation factor
MRIGALLCLLATISLHHEVGPGEPHVHTKANHTPRPPGHRVIAVCGKGGVGKTAFTALLTRSLIEQGDAGRLLAVDADPALGLSVALGLDPERTIGHVRERIIRTAQQRDRAAESELARELDYVVLESLVETEDFAFLAMGRSEALGCYCSVNDLLRDAITLLSRQFDTIVIDGEAGVEQINRQVLGRVDQLILLTDGSARGMRTVELLARIAHEEDVVDDDRVGVVVNRHVNHEGCGQTDLRGLRLLGTVPFDPLLAHHDATNRPLLTLPPDSLAVHEVWHIVDRSL